MDVNIPLVGEVVRREIYIIGGEEPVSRAVGAFRKLDLPLVIVMDNSREKMLGILTERIVLRSTFNIDTTKAKSVALKSPIIRVDKPVSEAARLMLENNLKALPVEEDGKLVGTISIEDIVQALGDRFFSRFKVRDVMSRDPITITPETTIGQALVLMRENGISRLPVIQEGKLSGILTIHDIIVKVIQPRERATRGEVVGEKLRTLSHQVKEIMTPVVITASPDEPLSKAIKRMFENDVSCLVVTQDSRVIGIITRADILEPVAALAKPTKPRINVQLSFKVERVSESDKQDVMEVVNRYLDRLGESLGVGYLMLHFKEHKEKHGETHLIHCRARLNTDKVQLIGLGEAWTPAQAARIALDKIERRFLIMKETAQKYPYAEEILTRMAAEM